MLHDDVIKWKHFPRNWPFVREIHRSPVNFPHKDQWRGALMFSLIYVWINDWVNNREAGDLRRQHGHYDVIVMIFYVQGRWYFDLSWITNETPPHYCHCLIIIIELMSIQLSLYPVPISFANNLHSKMFWVCSSRPLAPCMGQMSGRCSTSSGSTWWLQSVRIILTKLTFTTLNISTGKWKRLPQHLKKRTTRNHTVAMNLLRLYHSTCYEINSHTSSTAYMRQCVGSVLV